MPIMRCGTLFSLLMLNCLRATIFSFRIVILSEAKDLIPGNDIANCMEIIIFVGDGQLN